jgi:heterogeneous nuclear ribonucleoprotein A1/A3
VQKEITMLKMICAAAVTAALVVLMVPSKVDGYGAAHVGYTHVGPNGVYHTGETVGYGPGGSFSTGHTSAYGAGGGEYHGGYGYGTTAGGAAGGYRYGGAAGGDYRYGGAAVGGYGYVR